MINAIWKITKYRKPIVSKIFFRKIILKFWKKIFLVFFSPFSIRRFCVFIYFRVGGKSPGVRVLVHVCVWLVIYIIIWLIRFIAFLFVLGWENEHERCTYSHTLSLTLFITLPHFLFLFLSSFPSTFFSFSSFRKYYDILYWPPNYLIHHLIPFSSPLFSIPRSLPPSISLSSQSLPPSSFSLNLFAIHLRFYSFFFPLYSSSLIYRTYLTYSTNKHIFNTLHHIRRTSRHRRSARTRWQQRVPARGLQISIPGLHGHAKQIRNRDWKNGSWI